MGDVDVVVWLSAAYGLGLLAVAFGLDAMARRTATRTTAWRSGAFTYHEDHDAWICPQDQWLWPTSFDPDNRVMRYRASPAVCNSCPVKHTCTTSEHGREITRNVDPWPSSEAERFHRGIACAVAVLGVVWPAAMALSGRSVAEALVLLGAAATVAAGSWPLWSHLRRTPAAFPEHVPHQRLDEAVAARAVAAAREARRRTGYASDRRSTGRPAGPVPAPDGGIAAEAPGVATVPVTPSTPRGSDADRFTTRWGWSSSARSDDELLPPSRRRNP